MRRVRVTPAAALAVVVAVALALRLHGIGERGFLWDEISLYHDALSGHEDIAEAPATILLLRALMRITGRTDAFAVHLLPAFLGSATPVVAYLLGRELASARAGLALAAAMAVAPMAAYHAQELRPYALLGLTIGALHLTQVRALRRPTGRAFAAHGAAVAAAVATHLVASTVVAAGVLAYGLAAGWSTWRKAAGPRARDAAAFVASAVVGWGVGGSWMSLGAHAPSKTLEGPAVGGLAAYLESCATGLGPETLVPAAVFVGLAGLGAVHLMRAGKIGEAAVLGLTVLTTLALVYSNLGEKASWWSWHRYLSHVQLGYLALVVMGVEALLPAAPSWRSGVLLAAVLASIAAGTPALVAQGWQRGSPWATSEPYRIAADVVAAKPWLTAVVFQDLPTKYGDESDRPIALYRVHRHDRTPMLLARGGQLYPVREEAGRFGVGTTHVVEREPANVLPGAYAVFDGFGGATCASTSARFSALPLDAPMVGLQICGAP